MPRTIDTQPQWHVSERRLISTDQHGLEETLCISYDPEDNRIRVYRPNEPDPSFGFTADAIPALQEILNNFYAESSG